MRKRNAAYALCQPRQEGNVMSSKRNKAAKQSFWSRLTSKGRMYFVLAICCAIVLVTSLTAFLVVHGLSSTDADPESQTTEEMVDEEGYDKDQNTIDKYVDGITLEQLRSMKADDLLLPDGE